MVVSGIITTNLGKTATITEVAGRERRVHHSKSLPLLLTGERFFLSHFHWFHSLRSGCSMPDNGSVMRFLCSRLYFFPSWAVFVLIYFPDLILRQAEPT